MRVTPILLGVLALPLPMAAHASTRSDVAQLRAELEAMRSSYESRIAQLEKRLAESEKKENALAQNREQTPPAYSAPVADAAVMQAPSAPTTDVMPKISLVLQGGYRAEKDIANRTPVGFLPASSDTGSKRGFSVDESELVLDANVDPYWKGHATFSIIDGAANVEEAWFQSLQLGDGLTAKGGRFLSNIGYLNNQHPHMWDFADAPLMYQVMFGDRLSQDGVQVTWLAPTDQYLEVGAEIGNGNAYPGTSHPGAGDWTVFAHTGGDVGISSNWRAGISYVQARADNRKGTINDLNDVSADTYFSGKSRAWLADFSWKWAPNGNNHNQYFKLQSEYFHRNEGGQLDCSNNLASGGSCVGLTDNYTSQQSGWYLQGVYQFMPRWRVGLRQDQLNVGTVDLSGNAAYLPATSYKPEKTSIMLDYSPSEFSRFRVQWAQDRSIQNLPDNVLTLQYIMSLGAHGAHTY